MNRWGKWLLALAAAAGMAVALSACGGGSDEEALPSAAALCGSIGLQPKVLNGADCGQPDRSPVILLNVIDQAGKAAVCSGTLITPNKILTAAHCVPAGTRRVLAGLWNADGNVVGIAASSWTAHPQYVRGSDALTNDVAIVTLSRGLPNPTMGILVSAPSARGQSVFVAGWGAPGFALAVGAARLTTVNEISVGYTYDGKLSNTCNGDSGGPAYRPAGDRQGVVGITSSGTVVDCGKGDESLFTNVQSPSVINFVRSLAPEAAYL